MAANDLAARPCAAERPSVPAIGGTPTLFRRMIAAIEPWYDWGTIWIERLDAADETGGDGEVAYFQIQWFGIHAGVQIGRTPKKVVR